MKRIQVTNFLSASSEYFPLPQTIHITTGITLKTLVTTQPFLPFGTPFSIVMLIIMKPTENGKPIIRRRSRKKSPSEKLKITIKLMNPK